MEILKLTQRISPFLHLEKTAKSVEYQSKMRVGGGMADAADLKSAEATLVG
jgi:hypothetical protein